MTTPPSLADLLRDLEGSTHGGPKHAMVFESIRTVVHDDPESALDQIEDLPTSANSVLIMVVSGVGRPALPMVMQRLITENQSHRNQAAMILCIWATRGLLSGWDRPSIEQASTTIAQKYNDRATVNLIEQSLSRLRT